MEDAQTRLKRLKMRSWRRGTKEMDLILGPYADAKLGDLGSDELERYERLLEENDQELYLWISSGVDAPERYASLFDSIRAHHGISLKV